MNQEYPNIQVKKLNIKELYEIAYYGEDDGFDLHMIKEAKHELEQKNLKLNTLTRLHNEIEDKRCKLHDTLDNWKTRAEFLYRYGDPGGNIISNFKGKSQCDKKRLLNLAFSKGDKDIKEVAQYIMKKIGLELDFP